MQKSVILLIILGSLFHCRSTPEKSFNIPEGQKAEDYIKNLNDELLKITAYGYPVKSSIQSLATRNEWFLKAKPVLLDIYKKVPPGFAMFVVGHSSSASNYENDLLVSKYRALFMYRFLQSQGLDMKKLMVTGAGTVNPANSANLADTINDRVSFEIRSTIINNGKFQIDWNTSLSK